MALKKTEVAASTIFLWKKHLSTKEIQDLANENDLSVSTVYKISRGMLQPNNKTQRIVELLNIKLFEYLSISIPIMQAELDYISKIDSVKKHLNIH